MAEPCIELIAQAIATQAESITVANGYTVDVESVIREVRRENELAVNLRIILRQGEKTEAEYQVQGAESWVVPFFLHCIVRPGDDDPAPMDTYRLRFAANVEKAFGENSAAPAWYTGGIYIHFLRGTQPLPDTDEFAGCDGITVIVEVQYRHLYGDPFTAA